MVKLNFAKEHEKSILMWLCINTKGAEEKRFFCHDERKFVNPVSENMTSILNKLGTRWFSNIRMICKKEC